MVVGVVLSQNMQGMFFLDKSPKCVARLNAHFFLEIEVCIQLYGYCIKKLFPCSWSQWEVISSQQVWHLFLDLEEL